MKPRRVNGGVLVNPITSDVIAVFTLVKSVLQLARDSRDRVSCVSRLGSFKAHIHRQLRPKRESSAWKRKCKKGH